MTATRRSRLRGRLSGDGGFALVEVMVSAVLLVVLATATLNIIDKSGTASATTRLRSAATGLAQEDQDGMRVMSVTKLDRRDYTYNKTVGGIQYTIRSVAEWVRDGGTVTCDSNTARVEYLKTTSYVTWPGHTNDPVTLESYISPGVESISKGSLMVKLHTDPGVGVPNVRVNLSTGQSGVTDQTGCVMFTGLDAGTLVASWDGTAGDYVDRNGIQSPAENITIGAGQTAQIDRLWDKAGHAVIRWVDENGTAVLPDTPTTASGGIGAGVSNSLITKPTPSTSLLNRLFDNQTNSVGANTPLDPHIAPITAAGQTTKINELFPYTQPYSVWSGGCTDNIPPATYRAPTVVIPAGLDSTQVNVLVPTATVTLSGGAPATTGTNPNGTFDRLKLVNVDSSAFCIDSNAVPIAANGSYNFHVPAGTYNICIQKVISGINYVPSTTAASITVGYPTSPVTVPAGGGTRTPITSWMRGTC